MKNLSILDKILLFVNSILAIILLISFLSYFISPYTISIISFISLSIPFLIILNLFFAVYWALKLKRQFLISTIVLLVGIQYVTKLYGFTEKKVLLTNDLKVMSYNVRMFNLYNWIDAKNIDKDIYDFIIEKDPDILCLQETNPSAKSVFKFPYKYVNFSKKSKVFGYAIYSKYKIINSGSLNFSNSTNNTIFIDILKNKDTVRIYSVHLESLKINPNHDNFNKEINEKLMIRLENSFKKQVNQVNLINQHQEKITHKSIICGDFNNTAFSWVYKQLKRDKDDAFEVAGKGFGKTYDFKFPLRIDFILTDKRVEVNNFKTFDVKYSDHFPIMARINLSPNNDKK